MRPLGCGALLLLFGAAASAREHIPLLVPFQKFSQTLIASADLPEKSYIVVPISLQIGPDEMLIGMKRGEVHARDREAVFEINAYQPSTGRMLGRRASLGEPGLIYYNGEFVRHANDAIDCFVDVQQGGAVERLGLRVSRSIDGGKTFSTPRRVGTIEGVEYGYVFDSVVRNGRTYMLAMRFANLAGGKSLHPRSPMQLCWFRFSPESLALETCLILDNAERNNVVDGYYATAHWRERDGVVLMNILTYKRADFVPEHRLKSFHDPDLIRLEFVWNEVK